MTDAALAETKTCLRIRKYLPLWLQRAPDCALARVPKQYRPLAGKLLLARTLEIFAQNPRITQVAGDRRGTGGAVCRSVRGVARGLRGRIGAPVIGGETRQASVHRGLQALRGQNPSHVLIHDARRGRSFPALIDATINAVLKHGAVIPGVRIVDTVKHVDADNIIHGTLERDALRLAQSAASL